LGENDFDTLKVGDLVISLLSVENETYEDCIQLYYLIKKVDDVAFKCKYMNRILGLKKVYESGEYNLFSDDIQNKSWVYFVCRKKLDN